MKLNKAQFEQFVDNYAQHIIEGLDNDSIWSGTPEQLLKFAQEIRKQTIDEILTSLKEVPNPEANRTAIWRIMSIL
jgi:hypothetical protein